VRDQEAKSRPLAKRMRKAMTKAEVVLWSNLRSLNTRGYKFRRQHPIGPYVADFAHIAGKMVIEIDGSTHWTAEKIAHDRRRDAYLSSRGWTVVRFPNDDVYRDVSRVVEEIARRLTLT
jgi:very-short-patch-repair endonuclease